MLNKLSRIFLVHKLHDRRYQRFRAEFTALNLERVEKFSLITAVATTIFALLPNALRCLVFTEYKTANIVSLLFLEASATCFMLLFYGATQWLKEERKLEKKVLLVKSFIFITLLHALFISLAVYEHQSAIPVFLLSCCALMSLLYWSARRLLLFIGLGEFLYLLSHYTLYQDASLFHSSILGHLIFLSIFFFISRTILELKLRDFENAEKIESQTEQLQAKNQRLRITEHALTTLHRNNHQGVFKIQGAKGFTYVNDHMAEMMGFASASDLIREGKNFSFIPQQELDAIARKLNQQGFAEGLEVEATRRDGSHFWMQFNCSVHTDEHNGGLIYEGSAMDITHRKKALQEALENAAKLEQAEKIANAGFYEIDISSSRISYSAGYCAILEIPEVNSICLNDHLEYIHPDDRNEVRRVLLQAIMRGEDYNLQYRISNRNGEWKHLSSKGKVIQNDRGRDFKILGTVQDVTQIRQQQEALEQSQAIIRTAFDHNNHFGIYIFDRHYKLLEFNKVSSTKLKQWLGIDLVKGTDVRNTLRPVTAETFIPIFKKALEGESTHFEHNIQENTPGETWAEIYVGPVKNAQDEIIGAVMMAADITQRKRNEGLLKNLSLVASHTDNAVMISDPKHRVEWVNEAFRRHTGYELEEIRGLYPKDFMVSELTDANTLQQLNNCLKTGRSFTDEILLRNRSNEQRWVLLTVNPVSNSTGEVEKFVSIFTDLSERKIFEQELRNAKEAAEHSAEIKEYFLSTVSHELRTPLNAVIGLAYHLLQNNPRPDQEDDLSILKFSAENLLSLINDILDLSKIEAGKVHLEDIQFNLRDILNSLKHSFQTQTESKGLDFKLYLHDDVPHELKGDPVRLIQIITNLLSNAIKFTHQGMVKVEIKTKSVHNEQYLLQFEISDSGIGIPKEKLHTIFNKFEQASTTTNFTYGGTGLGLAITKQLVEIQGGTIWVKSTVGQGSCFGFSIPYRISARTDLQPLAYTFGVEVKKDLSKMHLLMAEDNQINQAVAGKFLQSWGICYDVAENGIEAVKMAASKKYDLVLMDLQMPEMDGFEATRQIRLLPHAAYQNTPVIAITAAGIAGIEEKIKEAGMTDMVLKPFKPETLLYKLNHYCPFVKETPKSMHYPQNTPIAHDLDLSGVLEVAGGDRSFLQELINLYIRQFTEVPVDIKAAVNAGDRVQLRRIFHKLRPSMLMLKIEKMTALGERIHQQLHDESSSFEDLNPLLDNYISLVEALKHKLQQKAETENLVLGS
ncbi:PAS domain S-box protein [Cesiribacter sp. SM1]|uniref:PAS domain S-box protein n=1 Tax=Cesiribacter sp. SM1 TaxID=2861196 RepID=UPI001CD26E85|nr:PAS domain S-box protein [Cesiribacter sp. SM1]